MPILLAITAGRINSPSAVHRGTVGVAGQI